jgi:quercetin dioxygenase-like cupin family protein
MTLVRKHALRMASTILALAVLADAPANADGGKFNVAKLATKSVSELPEGELYWHIETFATLEVAQAAGGDYSLAAPYDDKAWLFTLADRKAAGMGGTSVASVGPVPRIDAVEFLLQINSGHAPVGATTSIHSHPGPEAFLILSGQATQRTPYGLHVLNAGATMAGKPDQAMEVRSTGDEELRELIMFVVDPLRPFGSPAELN